MKSSEHKRALDAAVDATRAAGELLRRNLRSTKKINEQTRHDIKLELDVRSQQLIEKRLAREFSFEVLGEEGSSRNVASEYRWVIDPIDGTVNFSYGIPHACVSIALQRRAAPPSREAYETVVGAVYDPFADELWTAVRGGRALLNGRPVYVSKRRALGEAIVSIGFAKSNQTLERTLPFFEMLIRRIRKVRIMGSATLALTYVAMGRFDAYLETRVRLWDIAAGGLIVECAGGEFWREPAEGEHTYQVMATNGLVRRPLSRIRPPLFRSGK